MTVSVHHNDLPAGIDFGAVVAIDTETLGLKHKRDRLCVVQLSAGDGTAHLVTFDGSDYSAPNLRKLMQDKNVTKLFHFARFDIAAIKQYLGVVCAPVYCTKLASKLARTYTDHHSLKTLCRELAGVELDKQQQTTDWGALPLTDAQIAYASSDVLYLHKIKAVLDDLIKREGRQDLLQASFDFLPARALLDLGVWGDENILAH